MKYYGKIGFLRTVDKGYGDWEPEITEREYYGEVFRNTHRWQLGDNKANSDFNINNQIRILIDEYFTNNIGYIAYITWLNSKWKVTNVTLDYPGAVLEIGGLYNGE